MMKNIIAVILTLSFVNMFADVNAYADEWTGNVNVFLGRKTLDEDDWAPFEEQAELGVLFDFRQQSWPVSIAIDLLGSVDKESEFGVDLEGSTSEFDIGVRKIWEPAGSTIRPYIGGGLAFINAEIKATDVVTVSVDDNGTGIWLNGGVYWTIGQSFNLGFDIRYSQADVTFFGIDADAGGNHVGVIAGYHW